MPTAFLQRNKDMALVLGVALILTVLFAPIPPVALDLAILINFGLSLTILLLTFYVARPVDFSTFPSLLLIATLLRLSLNVAATRLILTGADAGAVINAIGSFAVAGNFVVGLVVFIILVVVQYIVVTSGAQRVSEVAARFMLDSMPGQQMSIDADLNLGLIDQKEALTRRQTLEREAAFYGAMDGASKFVKGDSIAGIIILVIDIIAGWFIGVSQMGMSWDEALKRFTLLTVGDGIATQLPALIISIATGIIVTRSSADRDLSSEVLRQLSSIPRVPLIVTVMLATLLLLPGMPKWPLLLLLGLGVWTWRRARRLQAESETPAVEPPGDERPPLSFEPIAIAMGGRLRAAWQKHELAIMERIAALREAQEQSLGIGFPPIKLVEHAATPSIGYEILIFGVRYGHGEIEPDMMLAIRGDTVRVRVDGSETSEPAFGLPAVWIADSTVDRARDAGYTLVDPITVFITHLGEVLRAEAPTLLTRAMTVRLLEGTRSRQPGLVEELIPTLLSVSDVQRLLQNLLSETVSIAHIDLILEYLVDVARTEKDPGLLNELVRQRLSHAICSKLRDRHRDLAVISLDPRTENQILSNVTSRRDALPLDPRLAEQLIRKLSSATADMLRQGREPVLLCAGDIRRALKSITRRSIPRLAVLSVSEIPTSVELSSFAIVRLEDSVERRSDPQRVPTAST